MHSFLLSLGDTYGMERVKTLFCLKSMKLNTMDE